MLSDLKPLSSYSPDSGSTTNRRQSSPGLLFSPVKTPVNDEVKVLWKNLELQKPNPPKCSDIEPRAFEFQADTIVSETVVKTDREELTPHNRITLDDVFMGVAARGPKNARQAEVIFTTALQEKCGVIVSLITHLEGTAEDYLPDAGTISTFGAVTVERIIIQDEHSVDPHAVFPLRPIHTGVKVTSGDVSKDLVFHWERGMANHVSAAPELLVQISNELPDGPILFHCQKGVGRTAMVMLVHGMKIKKQQGLRKEFAIPTLVKMIEDGRKCRGEFLENDRQLQSVLKAVALMYGMTDEQLSGAVGSVSSG